MRRRSKSRQLPRFFSDWEMVYALCTLEYVLLAAGIRLEVHKRADYSTQADLELMRQASSFT